jgi:hypothetical protein
MRKPRFILVGAENVTAEAMVGRKWSIAPFPSAYGTVPSRLRCDEECRSLGQNQRFFPLDPIGPCLFSICYRFAHPVADLPTFPAI